LFLKIIAVLCSKIERMQEKGKQKEQKPKDSTEKSGLHPRNPHRFRYDFKALIASCPDLEKFVSINKFGDKSIDFANPDAVKMLNRAILKHFYLISLWDIPKNYLCPPIPGRSEIREAAGAGWFRLRVGRAAA